MTEEIERCKHGEIIKEDIKALFAGPVYICDCCQNGYGSFRDKKNPSLCPACKENK